MHLVLDTTSPGLTLGLYDMAGHALLEAVDPTPRAADHLHSKLAETLETNSITAGAFTHLTLTVGPGSFTGARIGLAVAEALRLFNPDLKITGLSTLQAHASQLAATHPSKSFTILLDAAGQTVYRQSFNSDGLATTEADCVETVEALASLQPGATVVAAPSLMLSVENLQLLAPLQPRTLLEMSANPAFHMPAEPFYLKPLTYKKAGE